MKQSVRAPIGGASETEKRYTSEFVVDYSNMLRGQEFFRASSSHRNEIPAVLH